MAGKPLAEPVDAAGLGVDGENGFAIEQKPGEVPDAAADFEHALPEFARDQGVLPGEVIRGAGHPLLIFNRVGGAGGHRIIPSLDRLPMFYLHRLFYSFLPLHNPIGFGAADFVELALALALVGLAFGWQKSAAAVNRFAQRTAWCMAILAAAPVILRLAMLPASPIPTPLGADDFSYLLLGDTLAHFRLTNPVHPMHRFFETFFVLQEPSYSSIYPLGPGLALAFGQLVFRLPWAGIALATAAFAALCYWMLRAWTKPGWALLGGALAVAEFGPLNHWMNTYWGGSLAAAAGCLVFGAMPRLKERWRTRDALLLGAGLAIHALTRPFESVLLGLCVALFFAPDLRRRELWRATAIASAVVAPALGLIALHDSRVTGNWATLPYALCRYQYGVPSTFTVQPSPVPHRELTREQKISYDVQTFVHGEGTDTWATYLARVGQRFRFYRFFFLPPLYLALPALLWSWRDSRMRYVVAALAIFFFGTSFYGYFYAHYIAAVACLFLLATVKSLDNVSRLTIRGNSVGLEAVRVILFLCGAHFLFWYGIQLAGNQEFAQALEPYETWDEVNHGDLDGRIGVNRQLEQLPGKQLVFVRYWPKHTLTEWVYNGAEIDRQRVVFARDLGGPENDALLAYYPDRTPWLLEPDATPPRLTKYAREAAPAAPAPPHPQTEEQKELPKKRPRLKFEVVK